MTNLRVTKRLDFDLDIKKTICNMRKSKQEQEIKIKELKVNPNANVVEMPNQLYALQDYAIPSTRDTTSSVFRPPINASNFRIKPFIIHMI